MQLTLGDFIAQTGKEDAYRLTIEITVDNGTRLIGIATAHNLRIKQTMFGYKNIYKQTGVSNDDKTKNQIDHELIDTRHANNYLDALL